MWFNLVTLFGVGFVSGLGGRDKEFTSKTQV